MRKKKENSTELQKAKVEAEVYNINNVIRKSKTKQNKKKDPKETTEQVKIYG